MKDNKIKRKLLWPAVIVALLSLLWLAAEMKWINSDLPLGPFALLAVSLALIIYELRW
ncbi:MAG: hypothetical protein WC492_02690 [Candidatus Micrarchaeia archaeon]